jgi:hypothetical protein
MRKQTGILIVAALVLGTIYALKFTDWFGPKNIQILFTTRRSKAFFGLDGKEYSLNTIKVYRAGEISTNKYAHALWHLVATNEKGSTPVTEFVYGETINGMKPAVPGTGAEPLKSKMTYRIFIESEKASGQRDFEVQ